MVLIGNRYKIVNFDENLQNDKIYIAKDTFNNNKRVILKLIQHTEYVNKDFITDLIDEMTGTRDLTSPYILKILDVGIQKVKKKVYYYIVSPFFDGITLDRFMESIGDRKLSSEDVISIITKILKSLEFMHSNGIYHGNLSSKNILINDNLEVKVLDFLITKSNKGEVIRDNDLSFLSPQQISVNFTSFETDFYTLGLILFNLMFNEHPYEVSTDESVMLKNIDKGIKWEDYIYKFDSVEFYDICKKLLVRQDSERYKDMKDVLLDVTNILYNKAKIQNKKIQTLSIDNLDGAQKKIYEYELKYLGKNNKMIKIAIALIIIFIMIIFL
ncbi:MAG: protein kinase [Peptostreptococcaceae bacterium]